MHFLQYLEGDRRHLVSYTLKVSCQLYINPKRGSKLTNKRDHSWQISKQMALLLIKFDNLELVYSWPCTEAIFNYLSVYVFCGILFQKIYLKIFVNCEPIINPLTKSFSVGLTPFTMFTVRGRGGPLWIPEIRLIGTIV